MKTMSAREARNAFGLMIDTARAEPVLIEKHGAGVVVVVSVEEWEKLYQRQPKHRRSDNGSEDDLVLISGEPMVDLRRRRQGRRHGLLARRPILN